MRDDVESLEYVVGNAYCLDILDWMGYVYRLPTQSQ